MIVLTSFKNIPKDIPAISVARYMPRGFHLPEMRFLAPINQFGERMKGFTDHNEFRRLYKGILQTRKEAIKAWLVSLDPKRDQALVCWCNIQQQRHKGYEQIMCHTILLGFTIQKHRPDIKVFVDDDRYQYSIWEHDFQCYDTSRRRRSMWGT